MSCKACKQLLEDLIDGELSGAERFKVEQHIRECKECRREVEFLQCLSRDVACLPKGIQPDKDLWPGIEAEIIKAPRSKSEWCVRGRKDLEGKWERNKAAAWGWRIAVAAMLGLLLLAGTYLALRKQAAKDSNPKVTSNAPESEPSGNKKSPLSRSFDNRPDTTVDSRSGIIWSRDVREFTSQPFDLFDKVFVSNYGFYAVNQDRDQISLAVSRNYILRFDQNSTQAWIPPLPPGSTLISVYPGDGNRLWASYEVQEPEFQSVITELDFGVDSQVREIWNSYDLYISRFAIGPQGLIYAAGFQNDYNKAVAELTKGQSITTEFLHIIDTRTGEKQDLFPITLHPEFDSKLWVGQTVREMNNLVSHTVIAVKSNGNFFVTTDRTAVLASVRGLIKNEAVEYSSNGTVARMWDLGRLEPNAYLNKIFVDVDDSILAEIIRHPDTGSADSLNRSMIERYLFRVDPSGRITRFKPVFYSDEVIQGWIGQSRELITTIKGERMQQISIHMLPF